MPNPSRRIVQTETLSFQAVCAFIVFTQDAAIEYAIHASPRDDGCLAGFERVPVTEPEIKLAVLRTRTEGWFCELLRIRMGDGMTLDCCKQGKNKMKLIFGHQAACFILRGSFAAFAFDMVCRPRAGAAKGGMYLSSPRPWGVNVLIAVFILAKRGGLLAAIAVSLDCHLHRLVIAILPAQIRSGRRLAYLLVDALWHGDTCGFVVGVFCGSICAEGSSGMAKKAGWSIVQAPLAMTQASPVISPRSLMPPANNRSSGESRPLSS